MGLGLAATEPPPAVPIPFVPCALAWGDVNFDAPGPRKHLRRIPGRPGLQALCAIVAYCVDVYDYVSMNIMYVWGIAKG